MAKITYAAVLRLVNPEVNKNFLVSYTLPNTNKPTKFEWNKENNWEVEIPTKITYRDDHKKVQVFHENYAKFLIDAYGQKSKFKLLEFVKQLTKDEFDADPFADVKPEVVKEEPKAESVPEVQEKPKPKGK